MERFLLLIYNHSPKSGVLHVSLQFFSNTLNHYSYLNVKEQVLYQNNKLNWTW
jgi:hypothetical protein